MRKFIYLISMLLLAFLFMPMQNVHAADCGGLPTSGAVFSGTYDFAPNCVHTLTATLTINTISNVTINMNGGTIQGNNLFALFDNEGRLTINDGILTGSNGGIRSIGIVTISNSAIKNNSGVGILTDTATIKDSAFINNTGGLVGGLIISNTATVSGSCFENNVGLNAKHLGTNGIGVDARGNWWGSAAAPIQTNIAGPGVSILDLNSNVDASNYLTVRPDSCNAPVGNWEGETLHTDTIDGPLPPPDDRINWNMGDNYAIGYRGNTSNGGALVLWCTYIGPDGKFALTNPPFVITPANIKDIPEELESHYLIKEMENDYCHILFHKLSTGPYQLTMGPDEKGNLHELIFSDLSATDVIYHGYNVLTGAIIR